MQAQGVFAVQPEGNYVFIKGNSADPNADFLFEGQMEVLQAAVDAGKIKNVGEAYTDNWNPEVAQANMEQFLTANNNEVDAVVASNDGTAGGAIAALTAQGLAGAVPVSGQDGDHAALNRIALGTQTVSVWKDARELGKRAGEIAVALAGGTAMDAVEGASKFSDGPKGVEMNAVLLAPVPITKDNLNVVIDAAGCPRMSSARVSLPVRLPRVTDRLSRYRLMIRRGANLARCRINRIALRRVRGAPCPGDLHGRTARPVQPSACQRLHLQSPAALRFGHRARHAPSGHDRRAGHNLDRLQLFLGRALPHAA